MRRRGFTAIELATVVAIMFILVSTGTVVAVPALRKAAFNQSLARLEDVVRQARQLARTSTSASDFYGVVLRQQGGRASAAVTYGPVATGTTIAVGSAGQPLAAVDLGPLRIFRGSSHAAATALPPGGEIGLLFRPGSGALTASTARTLTPSFLGVTTGDLDAAGVVDRTVVGDQAVSLRTADGRRASAVAVYATGAISTAALAGR